MVVSAPQLNNRIQQYLSVKLLMKIILEKHAILNNWLKKIFNACHWSAIIFNICFISCQDNPWNENYRLMIAYLSQHEGESVHPIWPTNKETNKQQAITAQHKDIQQSNHFGMGPWRCCWWKWQLKQKVITTGHGPRTNCTAPFIMYMNISFENRPIEL